MKKHFLLFTLLLALMVPMAVIGQTHVIPYTEDFESYTNVGIGVGVTPTDWTVATVSHTFCEVIGTNSGKYLRIGSDSNISSTTRIVTAELPSFSSNLRVLKLTFKLRAIHTSGSLLQVGYNDRQGNFQSVQNFLPTDYQTQTTVTVDFNGPTGVRNNIIIKYTGNTADAIWLIDDVHVTFSPKTPNSLSATNVTGSSAYLSWSLVGNAEQYQVEYADNDSFSNAQTVSTSTQSVTLTSLSSETSYYARVRSVYGSSALNNLTYSSWSNVASFTTPAPTCLPPTGLTVSDITSTGATFAWDAEQGEVFQFFMRQLPYTYNEADFIHDGNEATYNGPYTYAVSFLPGTDNVFYLRKVCEGNDYSDPVSVEFHTPCEAITALGYSEYFDGYTVPSVWNPSTRILPSCWNAINTTTYSGNMAFPTIFNYDNNAYSGYNCLFIYSAYSDMTDPQPQYAIMPRMADLGGIEVTLWAKGHSEASTFKIGTMTDPTDASTFTEITEQALTTSYQRYIYAIPANTTDQYIAFMIDAADSGRITNGVYIDDIVIPTCSRPTGLHVAELTARSVRIEWDAEEGAMFQPLMPGGQPTYPFDPNNPPTNWNVEERPENYAIWNTLSPETTYGVWLRKYCSESDQSEPIYIMFTTPEACPAPTGLTVSFTETGYRFSWDAESGYEFYYTDAPVGNLPVWSTSYTTDNYIDYLNHYLGYNEDWTFYLKKKCSEDDYSEPVSITFRTKCTTTTALGYSENFDDYTVPSAYNPSTRTLPDCWNAINTTTYELYLVYPSIYNYNNNAHSGSNCLTIYSSYSTNNNHDPQPQYAILPLMDDLGGVQVTLWAKGDSNNTGVPSSFKIGTMSDPDDASTFTTIAEQPLTTSYQRYVYNIPANTTDKYIAFMIDAANSSRDINGVYIDDIAIPTCSEPTGLEVLELTAHSVTIAWDAEEGDMFQEDFNTLSFDPNEPPTSWSHTADYYNQAHWDGLEPEHFYGIWVRKYCSADDQSAPVYITFTTPEACPAPTGLQVVENSITSTGASFTWDAEEGASFEYFTISDPWEGYEPAVDQSWTSTSNNTVGWTNAFPANSVTRFYLRKNCGDEGYSDYTYVFTSVSNGTDAPEGYPNVSLPYCWQFLNRSESTSTYPQAFLSSSSACAVSGNCLLFKSSSTTPLYAILPEFEQNISEYQLTFTYRNEGLGNLNGTLYVGYMTDPSDASTFVQTLACTQTTTMTEKTAYFPNAPQGSFMAFKYVGGTNDNCYLGIDNVVVSNGPSCFPTGTLDCIGLTSTTATLSWTLIDSQQNAWVVEYSQSPQFFEPVVSVDANQNWNFVIEGLEPETQYYARVRANCGDDSYSDYGTVVTFTTEACPVPTNVTASNITQVSADISWTGSTDVNVYDVWFRRAEQFVGIDEKFNTSSLTPEGWEVKTGLLSEVMGGAALSGSSSPYWHFGTYNGVFDDHANLEVRGTACKSWLITPGHIVQSGDAFTFDLALTAWSGTVPAPETDGTDDRFVVLATINNGQTWDILREWNNNPDSQYVYNNIANTATGEHVSIDLTGYGYEGLEVRFAFYGESTENNADNNLHIDNVKIGTEYAAGGDNFVESQTTSVQLVGLAANMIYDVQVRSRGCDTWTEIFNFKTLDQNTKVFIGGQPFGDYDLEEVSDKWWNPNNWVPYGMPGAVNDSPNEDVILRHDAVISINLITGRNIIADANSITFEGDPKPTLTLEDGNQLRLNTIIDQPDVITVKKIIIGYGDAKDLYYLISSPVHWAGQYNPANGIVTTESDYDLYAFDPAASDNLEWRNYKVDPDHFRMDWGSGYLYANDEDKVISVTGPVYANNQPSTLFNYNYVENAEYTFNGWALKGNPWTCEAYLSSDSQTMAFYRMNAQGTGFEAVTSVIKPMEGFFLQNTVNGESVVLSRTAPSKGVRCLNLVLSQEAALRDGVSTSSTTLDNAIIRFDEGNTLEKLMFREGSSKIYMTVEGKDYAVVNASQKGELPINFKAESNGSYTLSFTSEDVKFSYLHLIDNLTGEDVDLIANASTGSAAYTFDAHATDDVNRFMLVFVTDGSSQNDFVASAAAFGNNRVATPVFPLLPTHVLGTHQDASPTTIDISLYPGWNWIAPTVEVDVVAMQNQLVCNAVLREEENTSVTVTPGQMVKVHVDEGGTFPLTGRPVSTSSVTIHQGNNWIGYIGETTTNIGAGIVSLDITPVEGDKIISQFEGFAIYTITEGVGSWKGTLSTLRKGNGYIYVRPLTE